MTDDSEQPAKLNLDLPPLPEEPLSVPAGRAKVVEALNALLFAIRLIEQASWREGFSTGWKQSQEWTKDQLQKFAEQASENAQAAHETVHHSLTAAGVNVGFSTANGKTAAQIVYDYIEKYPGKTGVEIVRGTQYAWAQPARKNSSNGAFPIESGQDRRRGKPMVHGGFGARHRGATCRHASRKGDEFLSSGGDR